MSSKNPNSSFQRIVLTIALVALSLSMQAMASAQIAEPGYRVMLTRSGAIKSFRQNPLTANVPGAIFKIVAIDGRQAIVKDRRGMAQVKLDDLIVLRNSDVVKQIESQIAPEHLSFAKAQFASLHNIFDCCVAFDKLLKANPNHEWARVSFADVLADVGDFDSVTNLLSRMPQDSDAWPVARVALAGASSDRESALRKVLKDDEYSVSAYILLTRQLLASAYKKATEAKPQNAKSELQEAFDLIQQMEQKLPERLESARLRLLLCEISWTADVELPDQYFEDSVKLAHHSLKQDPYNMELLADLSDTLARKGRTEEAAKMAIQLINVFPRSRRAAEVINRIAVTIPEVLKSSPYSVTTRMEIVVRDWAAIHDGIAKTFNADIPFEQDPEHSIPIRLVDGDGRRNNGIAVDRTTKLSALAILCADNNVACLRFLNEATDGIDFEQLDATNVEALFMNCVKSDSADAFQFLIELRQLQRLQDSAIQRIVMQASKQKAFGCLYSLSKNQISFTQQATKKTSVALGCKPVEVHSNLKEFVWDRAIEIAIQATSRYEQPVQERLELLKLIQEEVESLEEQKKTRFYGNRAAPVFIPQIHVYSGTTEPERGVRFRQAMQADIAAYTYTPTDADLKRIKGSQAEIQKYDSEVRQQLNYFFMETNAKLLQHFGRQVRLTGDGDIEKWGADFKQALKDRKSPLYQLLVRLY